MVIQKMSITKQHFKFKRNILKSQIRKHKYCRIRYFRAHLIFANDQFWTFSASYFHLLPNYLAKNLWFWTGIIFIRLYVSLCVCVCLSVCLSVSVYPDYLKKDPYRFWWNLAGWFIMINDSFLSKISSISSLEQK